MSERKKGEEKSRQRHFSTWLFVNFCVLVKTRGSARLLGWLESCYAGVKFECGKSARDELLKRYSMSL